MKQGGELGSLSDDGQAATEARQPEGHLQKGQAVSGDSYVAPPHGWTCFHCGETFKTVGGARDHFGADPIADPACRIKVGEERGLVMALRRAEEQLARYRAQDSDADREFYRIQADHAVALQRAEEAGFARGVADMKQHGWCLKETT